MLPLVDILVLLVYLVGIVVFGCWYVRKSRDTEHFMAGGRSLPGWVVGLSIFGTFVSSISFLANPGAAYGGNWNAFAFSLSLPVAAIVAVTWFVPLYRRIGSISAYDQLERRFGPWARSYAGVCYLLTQIARMGTILFLVAKAAAPLIGWRGQSAMITLIIVVGVLVTLYTLLGGIEAVIWTDVVQSVVLTLGIVVAIVVLLARTPGGADEVFRIAATEQKFSLGNMGASLGESTFWVVLIMGLFVNLQNFGIDQSYVQRYITAKDDAAARRSVWLGALLYIPISAMLFFIGTALFAFYHAQPDLLPAGEFTRDDVFPHFIATQLPVGMRGLLIAAVLAAAMSSVDSSLNSSATLVLCDFYKRYFRPDADDKQSMRVLHSATLVLGVIAVVAALAMIEVEAALKNWWSLASIFSGGMLGLFILGLIARRAGNAAAATGVIIGVLVILYLTLSPKWSQLDGTVSIDHGNTVIQGNETHFDEQVTSGEELVIADTVVRVEAIDAAKQTITLSEPFAHDSVKDKPVYHHDRWYRWRSPIHLNLVIVIGTLTILLVGLIVSAMRGATARAPSSAA